MCGRRTDAFDISILTRHRALYFDGAFHCLYDSCYSLLHKFVAAQDGKGFHDGMLRVRARFLETAFTATKTLTYGM